MKLRSLCPVRCRDLLGFLHFGHGGLDHPYKPITRVLILGYALVCVLGCYAFGSRVWGSQVVLADRMVGLNSLSETRALHRPNIIDDLVMQNLDLSAGLSVKRNDAGIAGLGNLAGHGPQLESAISTSPVSFSANPESVPGESSNECACDTCKNGGCYGVHEYVFWSFVGCFIGVAILFAISFLPNVRCAPTGAIERKMK